MKGVTIWHDCVHTTTHIRLIGNGASIRWVVKTRSSICSYTWLWAMLGNASVARMPIQLLFDFRLRYSLLRTVVRNTSNLSVSNLPKKIYLVINLQLYRSIWRRFYLWKCLSSGMLKYVVWNKFTDFSEVLFASRISDYHPDIGCKNHLWNIGKLLTDFTAQRPRRQKSSYSPPWEPKISLFFIFFCFLFLEL
jgi:hypothetical protein